MSSSAINEKPIMTDLDEANPDVGLFEPSSNSSIVEEKRRVSELESVHSKIAEPGQGEKGNILL